MRQIAVCVERVLNPIAQQTRPQKIRVNLAIRVNVAALQLALGIRDGLHPYVAVADRRLAPPRKRSTPLDGWAHVYVAFEAARRPEPAATRKKNTSVAYRILCEDADVATAGRHAVRLSGFCTYGVRCSGRCIDAGAELGSRVDGVSEFAHG